MSYFLSNTNFKIAPGAIWPESEVLGTIAYSVNAPNFLIFLDSVQVIRATQIGDYRILLKFKNNQNDIIIHCTTKELKTYTANFSDYKLDFIDVKRGQGCGCMVVTYTFMQWLMQIASNLNYITNNALQINPTYINNIVTASNDSNLSRVNSRYITDIKLTNAILTEEGQVVRTDKEELVIEEPSYSMTALRIKDKTGTAVLLKGTSIGFTITPPTSSATDDGRNLCRVHITTTPDNITFTDQSTGL